MFDDEDYGTLFFFSIQTIFPGGYSLNRVVLFLADILLSGTAVTQVKSIPQLEMFHLCHNYIAIG